MVQIIFDIVTEVVVSLSNTNAINSAQSLMEEAV